MLAVVIKVGVGLPETHIIFRTNLYFDLKIRESPKSKKTPKL